jgi:hypothetical protein
MFPGLGCRNKERFDFQGMPTNWLKNRLYPSIRLSRLWALEKMGEHLVSMVWKKEKKSSQFNVADNC